MTIDNSTPAGAELAKPATTRRNPALRGPVLLATDGTSQSGAAAIAAWLVAERLGVPMEVVTVLEPQLAYGATLAGVPVYLPEVFESRKDNRVAAVQEYLARHLPDNKSLHVDLRPGVIAQEITDVARERAATFVIVGAAPRQRLNHMVAGERAVQVLRSSTVPVLSVPPGFAELPKHIVVAVDFSPASVRAAQAALLLVADGGTLTLLHVLSPLLADAQLRGIKGPDPSRAAEMLFGKLKDELRPYTPAGVTIETRLKTDLHVDAILETAESVGAELVAVGTHGPRLLERLFVGSTASSVLHSAPQLVLAAPPPPPAEALELWLRMTGTATFSRPSDWAAGLDEFTRRNKGRRVSIEIDDPDLGAQMLGRGALLGATYDSHDKRVEIMVGDAHRARRHLMHSISNVESIAMTLEERMRGEVLELRHGRGQTLVLVGP